MSKRIDTLIEVRRVLQNKYDSATFHKPTYYKFIDGDLTHHIFGLITELKDGTILEIKTHTIYKLFIGADYKIEVNISNDKMNKNFNKFVSKDEISKDGILSYLQALGIDI